MTNTYPYYRVTTWLPQQKDCEEWFEWFKSLGQTVYIVKDIWSMKGIVRRVSPYSVWVVGKESMSVDNLSYSTPNSEWIRGDIMREFNGTI